MQRAGDKNFDKFELYSLKNVFTLPDNLQLVRRRGASACSNVAAPSPRPAPRRLSQAGTEEAFNDGGIDSEVDALWTQLQQALATKRELARKVAAAQDLKSVWAAHQEGVQQLAASQGAGGMEKALLGIQEVYSTLQRGWQLLRQSEAAEAAGGARGAGNGPRGLEERFAQRRAQTDTVGVPDLQHLSTLLRGS